jgi:hypothetical protein
MSESFLQRAEDEVFCLQVEATFPGEGHCESGQGSDFGGLGQPIPATAQGGAPGGR